MAGSRFADLGTMMISVELEASSSGSVLWLTLNRPQAFNAINQEMLEELHAVVDLLQHPTSCLVPVPEDHPRVLIIRAAGRAFSGGVDIKAADRGIGGRAWDYKDMRSQQLLARLIDKLRRIPQPVIAAVQGPAAGAGLAIALAADVRVALRASSFSAAFVRLGLTGTDMGTSFFMPRLAGLGVASEALLTGRAVPAERAYTLGLVNQLADSLVELEAAARGLAHDMLRCSPVGLQLTKEQLNAAAEGGSLRAALTAENSHQMLLVNQPAAQRLAKDWVDQMVAKGGGRGSGGGGGGGARSKL